jgi:hypothetical protein
MSVDQKKVLHMKRDELLAVCKEQKIKGISRKTKQELIEMILQHVVPKKEADREEADREEKAGEEADREEKAGEEADREEKAGEEAYREEKEEIKSKSMRYWISKEEAEKSADEWVGSGESLMRKWLVDAIMDKKQHRDIGKVLAYVAEIHVSNWLSEKTGRAIINRVGESYDGETDDDKPRVRHQVKFRMDAWHFETTRRNSKKNENTNSTGHVAYKKGEFDMLAIFKPGPTFGITGSCIRCIPMSALINPKKKDQLVTTINSKIRKVYDDDEKTEEVLRELYQTVPLPQD